MVSGSLATIVPDATKIIQPPMNADKTSASQAQDDALEVQTRVAEVEQQADLQARCPKVVDALGAMDLSDRLDGRQLDDH